MVEAPPAVRARLVHVRFGEVRAATALEKAIEERELELLAVVHARHVAEAHGAELVAVRTRPTAVRPRTHDEHVERAGVLLLDRGVGVERAEEILRVEPSADGHHGRRDVLQVRLEIPRFPERVVVRVRDEVLPERDFLVVVLRVDVRERPEAQEEVVAVG